MTIGELFTEVGSKSGLGRELSSREVTGIEYDSRRVSAGFLFFAFPGSQTDGRRFANEAAAKGAVAVVSESARPEGFSGNWIEVEHGRRALALVSRRFYGQPDEAIAITGITGTNGKTTCGFLIDSVLRAAGKITALVGTIEYRIAGRILPAVNTTPESLDLYRYGRPLLWLHRRARIELRRRVGRSGVILPGHTNGPPLHHHAGARRRRKHRPGARCARRAACARRRGDRGRRRQS